MRLHWLIGSAAAVVMMGTAVQAAPTGGMATDLKTIGGRMASVEKADYRRCGWYNGRRYCRWYRDDGPYPYDYYGAYPYYPYYYAPYYGGYYGYGPSFRFYYGGGGHYRHGGRHHH